MKVAAIRSVLTIGSTRHITYINSHNHHNTMKRALSLSSVPLQRGMLRQGGNLPKVTLTVKWWNRRPCGPDTWQSLRTAALESLPWLLLSKNTWQNWSPLRIYGTGARWLIRNELEIHGQIQSLKEFYFLGIIFNKSYPSLHNITLL